MRHNLCSLLFVCDWKRRDAVVHLPTLHMLHASKLGHGRCQTASYLNLKSRNMKLVPVNLPNWEGTDRALKPTLTLWLKPINSMLPQTRNWMLLKTRTLSSISLIFMSLLYLYHCSLASTSLARAALARERYETKLALVLLWPSSVWFRGKKWK